jgi:DNA polymerase III delta prime subunit
MAKTCKPPASITIEEDEHVKKKPTKLAPIFLPQKRGCTTPTLTNNNHKNKKQKVRSKRKSKRQAPSPRKETEVVLSSDSDDTIIDPFEVDTDTDSHHSSPILEQITGATREEEHENNVWSEKRRPKDTGEVVGHRNELQQLKSYLNNFSSCRTIQDQYEIDADEVANLQAPAETAEAECAIICGKSGIGKTSVVYAAAGDLGMKVFEMNASSRRTGKILMESLQEATQSHHLRGQAAAASSNSSSSISNFFQKKIPAPASQISSNSVILLDDVDMIIDNEEQDDGFWRSLKTFIRESKVPVILTTTDFVSDILEDKLNDIQLAILRLSKPPLDQLTKHLLDICSDELDVAVDVDCEENQFRIKELIIRFDYDIRKCLNHLQFEGILFFEKQLEADPVVPNMEIGPLCQVLQNNSLIDQMTDISSAYEITEDKVLANLTSYFREKHPSTSYADFSFKPMDSIETERNLLHKNRNLCSRVSALFDGWYPDHELRRDILPYISVMCATESVKAALEAPELLRTRRRSRNRVLHYFESIGFYMSVDDRNMCSKLFDHFGDVVPVDDILTETFDDLIPAHSASVLYLGNCRPDSDSDTESSDC